MKFLFVLVATLFAIPLMAAKAPLKYACSHTGAGYQITFAPVGLTEFGKVVVAKRSQGNVLENMGTMSCRMTISPPYMPYVEQICSSQNLDIVIELNKAGRSTKLRTAVVYDKTTYTVQGFNRRPIDIASCWYQ